MTNLAVWRRWPRRDRILRMSGCRGRRREATGLAGAVRFAVLDRDRPGEGGWGDMGDRCDCSRRWRRLQANCEEDLGCSGGESAEPHGDGAAAAWRQSRGPDRREDCLRRSFAVTWSIRAVHAPTSPRSVDSVDAISTYWLPLLMIATITGSSRAMVEPKPIKPKPCGKKILLWPQPSGTKLLQIRDAGKDTPKP